MAATVRWDDVEVGTELPPLSIPLHRGDLVRYAGASGDFNPIHWNERFARTVGLPDVIAHGMLTMGVAVRVVTAWCGDPGAVLEYGVRFTKPVVVPDDVEGSGSASTGAVVEVAGKVAEKLDGGRVRVDLTATSEGAKVLGAARAVVQLA